MRRCQTILIFSFIILFLYGCANNPSGQKGEPADIPLASEPNFQISNISGSDKNKISNQTQKMYDQHAKALNEKGSDKYSVYSQLVDLPDKTTYTALGSLFGNVDTVKFKNSGFENRKLNDLPYLHRREINRNRKFVSSEYLFKTDSGYFYIFAYAPVRHLIQNEEDVIIAQDSLNRKSRGLIATLSKQK